jgi:hypothetical protein
MNKIDLEELVQIRINEAKILLEAHCYQGAYYLAGYSLECAIKVCIAKQVNQYDFPNLTLARQSYSHNLIDLLSAAGLKQKLDEIVKQNTNFQLNWAIAKDWNEQSRYERTINQKKANDLYEAITTNQSGVLPWLKTFWY